MPVLMTFRSLLLAFLLPGAALLSHAQGPGGMGGGAATPGAGGGRPGSSMGAPHADRGRGPGVSSHTGLQRGMTGRWWDDRKTAKSMGLNSDQQKRMDSVFAQNRDVLQQRYDAFVQAQAKLNTLKHSSNASETALFSEIQHTAQARAALEQAYTHMQLQIRGELTTEQAGKLDGQPQD